mmetsp:Transcript_19305/g.56334  ORF Transcript_19305/g.56334 Transcript_19305/m.56334 type:complete len:350 (+) Transcript_19305:718-1767(+)
MPPVQSGLRVVPEAGAASSGAAAAGTGFLAHTHVHRPDVGLLDLHLPVVHTLGEAGGGEGSAASVGRDARRGPPVAAEGDAGRAVGRIETEGWGQRRPGFLQRRSRRADGRRRRRRRSRRRRSMPPPQESHLARHAQFLPVGPISKGDRRVRRRSEQFLVVRRRGSQCLVVVIPIPLRGVGGAEDHHGAGRVRWLTETGLPARILAPVEQFSLFHGDRPVCVEGAHGQNPRTEVRPFQDGLTAVFPLFQEVVVLIVAIRSRARRDGRSPEPQQDAVPTLGAEPIPRRALLGALGEGVPLPHPRGLVVDVHVGNVVPTSVPTVPVDALLAREVPPDTSGEGLLALPRLDG